MKTLKLSILAVLVVSGAISKAAIDEKVQGVWNKKNARFGVLDKIAEQSPKRLEYVLNDIAKDIELVEQTAMENNGMLEDADHKLLDGLKEQALYISSEWESNHENETPSKQAQDLLNNITTKVDELNADFNG